MDLFSCCAYNDIDVKLSSNSGFISIGIAGKDNHLFLSFSPSQAKSIAEAIKIALTVIKTPSAEDSLYFRDANITYGDLNATTKNETEENTDEEKLEIEAESMEAEPLAGAA